MKQRTLRNSCSFEGRGLHTGKHVFMRLCPAPVDTGIVFVRKDRKGEQVKALASSVCSTSRSTSLGNGCVKVRTVEHLLSALTGMGIDNAIVELDGPEVPILDGSALPYAEAIAQAGVLQQDGERRLVRAPREILQRNARSGAWIMISPADSFSVGLTIDYGSRVIRTQSISYSGNDDYASEVAPCRTFCFLHDVVPQLMLGLIRGGSLDNALVAVEKPVSQKRLDRMARVLHKPTASVSADGFLGGEDLRFPDECARHKLLDLIGDMRLCGGFPCFRVDVYKPGHALNTAAALELFKTL